MCVVVAHVFTHVCGCYDPCPEKPSEHLIVHNDLTPGTYQKLNDLKGRAILHPSG